MNISLIVLLYFLAVARITRLINFDSIMDWLHVWAGNTFGPGSWQVEFLRCPWCIGMWVSLLSAWAPLCFLGMPGWSYPIVYVLVALSASMLTGLLSPLSSEDTDFDEAGRPDGAA